MIPNLNMVCSDLAMRRPNERIWPITGKAFALSLASCPRPNKPILCLYHLTPRMTRNQMLYGLYPDETIKSWLPKINQLKPIWTSLWLSAEPMQNSDFQIEKNDDCNWYLFLFNPFNPELKTNIDISQTRKIQFLLSPTIIKQTFVC